MVLHENTSHFQEIHLIIQLEIYDNQFDSTKVNVFRNISGLMQNKTITSIKMNKNIKDGKSL